MSMQHASSLRIVHPDDTVTRYTDVKYTLHRDSVHVETPDGEHHHHDTILTDVEKRAA